MYKRASKQKLRFNTAVGMLSVEQLWDLTITQLDALAVSLEKDHKASKGKTFLAVKTEKDKTAKLRFDIVLDVLNTKVELSERASKAAETKAHNQKILSKIQDRKDHELDEMSVEELEAQLR